MNSWLNSILIESDLTSMEHKHQIEFVTQHIIYCHFVYSFTLFHLLDKFTCKLWIPFMVTSHFYPLTFPQRSKSNPDSVLRIEQYKVEVLMCCTFLHASWLLPGNKILIYSSSSLVKKYYSDLSRWVQGRVHSTMYK